MKVLIVGIGALGGTIAARAINAGVPVRLATRSSQSAGQSSNTADVGCLVAARPELIFAAGVPRRRANLHPSCRD